MSESTTIRWEQDGDRRRHPRPRRPRPVGQHHEPGLPRPPSPPSPTARRPSRTASAASSSPPPRRPSSPAATCKEMIQVGPETTPSEVFDARHRDQARTCAASRPSASRSSPPSTARRSAAVTRSRSPATTAIALDAPGSKIGLPEVTLGLLPGGRRRHPYRTAARHRRRAAQGAAPGHPVHARAARWRTASSTRSPPPATEMLARARAFIDAHPESQQPWDVKGYRIPGGTPAHPKFAANLPAFPANLQEADRRRPLPRAPQHPRRGRRGLPGRLRDRAGHRGPLLHRAGHRPDRQEHDPGVLLRPPGRQLRRQPPAGHRGAHRSARSPSSAPG